MTPNIPLLAFAPDADQATPGIIAEAHQYLPTARGYAPDFQLMQSVNYTMTLPAAPRGVGSPIINTVAVPLVGSANAIHYIGPAGVMYDLTRTTPYATTPSVRNGWRFAAFDNVALAVNSQNILQETASPTTGVKFTDVSGAPRANCIAVMSQFVMLANFPPDDPFPHADGWYCSAVGDHTDWTLDTATFCAQDRLLQTPGPILRLIAFGDEIIAFKPYSMLRGRFTGVPGSPWAWSVISTTVGIVGHDAVCEVDGTLYWMADSGVYAFSGGAVQRIASMPWEWFVARIPTVANLYTVQAAWDNVRRLVRFFYTRNDLIEMGAESIYGGIAYHPDSGRWGPFETTAAAVLHVQFDDVPQVVGTTAFVQTVRRANVPAIIEGVGRTVQVWRGSSPSAWFETGDMGDDEALSVLTKARLRARVYTLPFPAFVTATHKHRQTLDASLTTGATVQRQDGKFDLSHSARWHRLRFESLGMQEVTGISVKMVKAGER